jgi:hypothetical protein
MISSISAAASNEPFRRPDKWKIAARCNYSARFQLSPAISNKVSREFDEVLVFLERFQIAPATEQEPVIEPSLRVRLERFADGLCSDGERDQICEVLRADPNLVRWVAERVKQHRKS